MDNATSLKLSVDSTTHLPPNTQLFVKVKWGMGGWGALRSMGDGHVCLQVLAGNKRRQGAWGVCAWRNILLDESRASSSKPSSCHAPPPPHTPPLLF